MREAPKLLSTAIFMALRDLEAVERDPKYKVDMSTWHEIEEGDTLCSVCFAGSVMAKTLETPVGYASYSMFGDDWEDVFKALNSVLLGDVLGALRYMNLLGSGDGREWVGFDGDFTVVHNISYHYTPKLFKEVMWDIACMLEVNGY